MVSRELWSVLGPSSALTLGQNLTSGVWTHFGGARIHRVIPKNKNKNGSRRPHLRGFDDLGFVGFFFQVVGVKALLEYGQCLWKVLRVAIKLNHHQPQSLG